MISGFVTQDTIRPAIIVRINPNNLLPDSVFRKLDEKPAFLRNADSGKIRKSLRSSAEKVIITDTTSVCARNSIADITFYDSTSFVKDLKNQHLPLGPFPFRFAENDGRGRTNQETIILTNLKDGVPLPVRPAHNDLIVGIILLAAYFFLLVRSTTRSVWPEVARYFMLRGIGDLSSRDTGTLFSWQSSIMNLISFLILSVFAFSAAAWYDFIPPGFPPALFILFSFVVIIFGITSRHFICLAAGNLSGEYEIFNEYLITVYQSYRYSSLLVFILIVMLTYTSIIPPKVCVIAGLVTLGIFYFYRLLRLLLIFMKKDVSILYLILYLCALEILPVSILVKYFTGLV